MTRAGAIDLDALAGRMLPLLPRRIESAEFVAELRERMDGADAGARLSGGRDAGRKARSLAVARTRRRLAEDTIRS